MGCMAGTAAPYGMLSLQHQASVQHMGERPAPSGRSQLLAAALTLHHRAAGVHGGAVLAAVRAQGEEQQRVAALGAHRHVALGAV